MSSTPAAPEKPTLGASDPQGGAVDDVDSGPSASFTPLDADRPVKLDPIANARYEDIARRALQLQSRVEIAAAHSLSTRQLQRIVRDPRFAAVYVRVKDALYANVDGIIKDEKANVSLRKTALQIRQMTLLGEVMEAVRDHIQVAKDAEGTAANVKSTMLRAGVEAAREVSNLNRDAGAGGPTQAVQVNINVPAHAAHTMSQAARESGVDVSDLFQGEIVDVDVDAEGPAAEDAGN